MRGKSEGDPQSRDVPFEDPAAVDLATLTIGFVDNSETSGWPEAWDTPLKGQRGNVKDALVASGATVIEKAHLSEFFTKPQLLLDYEEAGVGNEWFGWWDWYWLNVEGFFEDKFKYGSSEGSSYGPWLARTSCRLGLAPSSDNASLLLRPYRPGLVRPEYEFRQGRPQAPHPRLGVRLPGRPVDPRLREREGDVPDARGADARRHGTLRAERDERRGQPGHGQARWHQHRADPRPEPYPNPDQQTSAASAAHLRPPCRHRSTSPSSTGT